MSAALSSERLVAAYETARAALLGERNAAGHWTGELSASALSTATAISALALVQAHTPAQRKFAPLVNGGLDWLVKNQNADGGWGDTVLSQSNISTSMLCRAALELTAPIWGAAEKGRLTECARRVDGHLEARFGKSRAEQAEAVRARYGKDRTFAVPILTTCALAGLVSWQEVPPLPFELACLPQAWFRFLRLPVVSYALPALIAIGRAVHHHRPPFNPVTKFVRDRARARSLRVLESIQPSSGGFLEATPLTSFVVLSLASIGCAENSVVQEGVKFLTRSARPDGSWPIDTNLATWVTTLAVNALAAANDVDSLGRKEELAEWLVRQQFKVRHPYTGAEPGGWGWTDLPGGVPDADDTPGALLALGHLPHRKEYAMMSAAGVRWLLDLQNGDGGWPTFCRGWGHLPFDRSGADLTAHALRAAAACGVTGRQVARGLAYLARTQRPDGSWLPLWFGNQHAPDDENPTYGTARVLAAYRDLDKMNTEPARRGIAWLLQAQNTDGGWGGAAGVPSSMEETALAAEILLDAGLEAEPAVNRGLAWLVQGVESGRLHQPAPIGFYFAKLWYFERLYPIIFTVSALGRACTKDACRRPHELRSRTP